MAVTVKGFSTYSEMRSANWPTREIFLSGVMLFSDQPMFNDMEKTPLSYFVRGGYARNI